MKPGSIASASQTSLLLTGSLAAALLVGCGGSGHTGTTGSNPPVTGLGTTVVLQASSDANARFVGFGMSIDSLSLTNKAGVKTTVYNTPTDVSFLPWNADAEPLATFTVPRDEYTAAAVTLSDPWFTYIFMAQDGQITIATDAYGGSYAPVAPVVNLAGPITVDGGSMGMTLSLQTPQSGTYNPNPGGASYSISPTFTLTPFSIGSSGIGAGMLGQITAIANGGSSLTLKVPGGNVFQPVTTTVQLNGTTAYQGVGSASDLAVGMVIDFDAAAQADGTYAATRVDVQDPAAADVVTGQLMELVDWTPGSPALSLDTDLQAGTDIFQNSPVAVGYLFLYGNTTRFQTSATFPDLASLPFQAAFDSSSMAAGQMVAVASASISYTAPNYTQATTVTLMPQYIDGRVVAQSTSGNFDVFTVQLAPYDEIVQMNMKAAYGVPSVLSNASTVYVYTDATTSMSANGVSGGNTYRFHGLLFNDGGTLRLACDKVVNGVPQ
jgi:hypothetical protein